MEKVIIIMFQLGLFSLCAVCGWALFTKANVPGWKAFVPFYNVFQYVKISGKPPWHAVGLFIPILGFYSYYVVNDGISKKFGHGAGTTLGIVFLPFIFLPMLAFGQSDIKMTPPPFKKRLKKPLPKVA